jgi:hypothetical protein
VVSLAVANTKLATCNLELETVGPAIDVAPAASARKVESIFEKHYVDTKCQAYFVRPRGRTSL